MKGLSEKHLFSCEEYATADILLRQIVKCFADHWAGKDGGKVGSKKVF